MSMKTSLSLGALAVVALLVPGIAYWAFHERSQPAAPPDSGGAPPAAPQASAPPPPPAPPPAAPQVQCSASTACTVPHPAGDRTVQRTRSIACHAAKPTRGSGARAGNSASLGNARSATATLPAEDQMSEADRRQVQEVLKHLNYYQGPIDGKLVR